MNFKNTILLILNIIYLNQYSFTQKTKKEEPKPQKFEIVKPLNYKEMKLPAENSSGKKFTFLRRFYNNTTTRYNYLYNCNRMLEEILDSSKNSFIDDFTQKPIPFYNFSKDFISSKFEKKLDSLLFKTTAGILLHDLRNKWVDDLYLYMGKAYFYKQEFDSAFLMFQYINYQYDEKYVNRTYINQEGFKKKLLSNTIVNREENTNSYKLFGEKYARNDALIWLILTHIEKEEYTDADVLINTLDNDVFFPERLKNFYSEVKAYNFYKRKMYLLSAQNLTNSIQLSRDRQEKARKCFLIAQLYNLIERQDLATQYLRDAIKFTYDPVLEIYSRLNFVLLEKHPNIYVINDHIKEMINLIKKERFKRYKDLIYYACSFMAIKKDDLNEALNYIQKSIKYNFQENAPEKNKIYFQLFNLLWKKKDYLKCSVTIDSLTNDFLEKDTSFKIKLPNLKVALNTFKTNYNIKQKEDSLQTIAKYSELDLDRYIKTKAKENENEIKSIIFKKKQINANNKLDNLNWNINDKQIIQSGIQEFISIWGNRKNLDNWRRNNNLNDNSNLYSSNLNTNNLDTLTKSTYQEFATKIKAELPLTKEKKEESNKKIIQALYNMAEIYYYDFLDYKNAIETYKDIVTFYPKSEKEEDIYLNLYLLTKENETTFKQLELNKIKVDYLNKYPKGKYAKLFNNNDTIKIDKIEILEYETLANQFFKNNFDYIINNFENFTNKFNNSKFYLKLKLMYAISFNKKDNIELAKKYLNEIINGVKFETLDYNKVLENAKKYLENIDKN